MVTTVGSWYLHALVTAEGPATRDRVSSGPMVFIMAQDTTIQIPKLRCSPFHSSLGVDPIGSAASHDAYMCADVPLPWQRDISMSEPFASLCDPPAASILGDDGRRWRPQGLVPRKVTRDRGGEPPARVRITTWEQREHPDNDATAPTQRNSDAVGPLRRSDWTVDESDSVALLRSILSGDPQRLDPFTDFRDEVSDPAFYVCSHGQRDICCGSLGMDVFGGLDELANRWDGEIRRCSHTGGHRFAATGISFPDGYAWAHVNPQVVDAIINRRVTPRELALHVRGSTLVPKGPPQTIDRLGLIETGWDWVDATRSIELVGFERRSMATDLRVSAVLADGQERVYEARVGVERFVPQITCGVITEPEYDVEPIWRIEDWRAV